MDNSLVNANNNNDEHTKNQMESSSAQDTLKRKSDSERYSPAKKAKEEPFVKPIPSAIFMGIDTPMDPDYRRLPKGFKLGDLAREKYAGIVMAGLYDKYEIQIYCRLFEHFSYYPIYLWEEDIWIPAHVHAVREIERFRTPPSVLMARARLA